MSYSASDWSRAIAKLMRMTSKKEVRWVPSELHIGDNWKEAQRAFQCELNDRIYVVGAGRKKNWLDDVDWYWADVHMFAVFSSGYSPMRIASAPDELSMIERLFEAVEQAYAFDNDALRGLL